MRVPFDHLVGKPIQAPQMKSVNGIGLLNLIRDHGPVSRADLAKMSLLSKPTVSSQVESLLREGLVIEQGPGTSGARGGKKPTLLRFNADCGRLVAVEMNPQEIRAALTDLDGRILHRVTSPTPVKRGADTVLARTEQAVRNLLERAAGSQAMCRLISIAASGRVDTRSGVVVEAGNLFNWRQVPVRERLESAFALPVFVDNNVNLAALAEMQHGAAVGESDFAVVRLDNGIGAGVVIRGKLHHGNHWAAGEIAHLVLDMRKAQQDWRERGYLESIVGADRIAAQVGGTPDPAGALAVVESAARGNRTARQIIDNITLHLGLGIGSLICAYDPALVVLQGELFRPLFEDIRRVAARVVPWEAALALSQISDEAVLLGAIVAAQAHAYEQIALTLNIEAKAVAAPA